MPFDSFYKILSKIQQFESLSKSMKDFTQMDILLVQMSRVYKKISHLNLIYTYDKIFRLKSHLNRIETTCIHKCKTFHLNVTFVMKR